MIGTNTLEINEATLLAALNCYFKTIYQIVPTATAVSEKTGSGVTYGGKSFTVTITDNPITITETRP